VVIGARIKALREGRKISREELAKNLNLSYWAIAKYESGERTPDAATIEKLATFFNVSVDYLLGRTNNPTPDHARKPTLEDEFPEVANVLRRSGKRLTPEDKKRIARIIKAAIEDVDEE